MKNEELKQLKQQLEIAQQSINAVRISCETLAEQVSRLNGRIDEAIKADSQREQLLAKGHKLDGHTLLSAMKEIKKIGKDCYIQKESYRGMFIKTSPSLYCNSNGRIYFFSELYKTDLRALDICDLEDNDWTIEPILNQ